MTDEDRDGGADRGGGHEGSSDPSRAFRDNPPADDEVQEIEEERERRLDPANRPDGAEVDNTGENMPAFLTEDQDRR